MSGLSYGELHTPMGRLLIVGSDRGLVRIGLPVEPDEEVLAGLERKTGYRAEEDTARVDRARRELDEYFAGRRRSFTMPLDLSRTGGFRRRSLEAMFEIFNLTDHVNFDRDSYVNRYTSPDFGTPTEIVNNSQRQAQFGVRFKF